MTDRELLELAAKAVGHESHWNLAQAHQLWKNGGYVCFWNPFTDDGDALRLAVKLKLRVDHGNYETRVFPQWEENALSIVEYENDPYAATRRAIVRAAAAIGEQA